jgi:hypothetical protein
MPQSQLPRRGHFSGAESPEKRRILSRQNKRSLARVYEVDPLGDRLWQSLVERHPQAITKVAQLRLHLNTSVCLLLQKPSILPRQSDRETIRRAPQENANNSGHYFALTPLQEEKNWQ